MNYTLVYQPTTGATGFWNLYAEEQWVNSIKTATVQDANKDRSLLIHGWILISAPYN
jgi:hypothetical protein